MDLARNSQIGPYVYPSVPERVLELAGRAARVARDVLPLRSVLPHDRHVHQRARTRSSCSLRSGSTASRPSTSTRQSSSSPATADGYVIGDAILFYLDNGAAQPRRPPVGAQLGAVPLRDRRLQRHDRARRARRGQSEQPQGCTATRCRARPRSKVLEKINGGPLPEIKFFNLGEITIAGRKVRALHHGMSGVPGLELFGPWDEGAEIKAAIVEAGEEFGLRQVGSRVYATNTLESGWIPCPLPAIFTGEDMKAYREWLPANGLRGHRLARRQLLLEQHLRLLPDALRPRLRVVREVRPRVHRTRGRRAAMAESPTRKKVTLAWNGEDVARGDRERCSSSGDQRQVHRPAALELLDLAERQDHEGRRDGRASRRSRATAPTRARCSRSPWSIVEQSEPGTEVTLVWGEEGGGSRKPVVERHVQTEIRAIVSPVPYAEVVRASYRPHAEVL